MEYSKFAEIILRLKSQQSKSDSAYKLKIDLIDFNDDLNRIIDLLIKEVYGEEGYDWFTWFCYESDFGEKDWSTLPCYKMVDGKMVKIEDAGEIRYGASDENGNPICHSIESTWEFLEANYTRYETLKTGKRKKSEKSVWDDITKDFNNDKNEKNK
jgi:hypothetical protein